MRIDGSSVYFRTFPVGRVILPSGSIDNSPAIHGGVIAGKFLTVPNGTDDNRLNFIRPWRDYDYVYDLFPTMNRWAIRIRSLAGRYVLFPFVPAGTTLAFTIRSQR